MIAPGNQELDQVQTRSRLPENESGLHSLLMMEGDLAAGDIDVPIEWFEILAGDGRVFYLEQGLWIAAEQMEEYSAALTENEEGDHTSDGREERIHIVRRMLRYRGGASASQTAERYGWTTLAAEEILEELCSRKEAVKHEDRYYHAELYRRARIKTLKSRREEISTSPGENYAALLSLRAQSSAPSEEALRNTLKQFAGTVFPASSSPSRMTIALTPRARGRE